jgi:O-antigen/teichoic acid export membrane protein
LPSSQQGATQVRAFVRPRPTLDRSVWRSLFRGGLPLVVLAALTQFYGNVDFMVLEWFGGDTAVGWYFIAYKWAGISFFICTAVVAAYFPRFSELAPAGGRPFADATNKALSLVVLVAVPFAFGLAAVADDLVRFLYGDDVLPAVPVMRILALQLPVTAVNTVLSSALMAAERVRGFIYVSLIACVLTPLSCILTVRAFVDGPSKGAVGAALVTTLTEVFVLGGGYVLRPSGVLDRATIGRCLRAVMAGAAMFDVLWILDDLPFIVKPLVGIVVYGAVAIALGIVAIRDVTEGANYVGRVIRRRDDTAQAVEQVEHIDHG